MPRLPPSIYHQAREISALLPPLVTVCRDLRSAQNELKWLKEHATQNSKSRNHKILLQSHVVRRARGEPLQYILGSEYFGNLEIKCRPGVLIPRQETAASIVHLVELLSTSASKGRPRGNLGVLDLCTGSGCIPLLFHHELYSRSENMQTRLRLVGMDISSTAVQLARDNLRLQNDAQRGEKGRCSARIESLAATRFIQADVLRSEDDIGNTQCMTVLSALQQLHKPGPRPEYDVLISNPPYISSKAFRTTTSRSVRKFEPKLALVPDNASGTPSAHDGDIFYPRLLDLVEQLNVKIVLFEVADMDQAERVASLAIGQGIWDGVEIWRDEPGVHRTQLEDVRIDDSIVRVRGAGHGRSVFAYRGDGI